ncbi:MAG: hypothetical protein JXA43_03645 [Candidatus Diapherotrites archaeon]|nr:hypothetical protein [Candidatus Diapherotrites archaeon]
MNDLTKFGYLFGVFVIAYILVYFIFVAIGAEYSSPTYWLIPLPIFFMAYYMPDFFDEEKKTVLHSIWIVPVFLLLSILAFWLATSIYFWNMAMLQGMETYTTPPIDQMIAGSSYLSVILFGTIALIYRQIEPKIIH